MKSKSYYRAQFPAEVVHQDGIIRPRHFTAYNYCKMMNCASSTCINQHAGNIRRSDTLRILQRVSMYHLGYPEFRRHMARMKNTLLAEQSFLSSGDYNMMTRSKFFLAREREGIVIRGGCWGRTFRVDGEVEASGAQAKKQNERVVVT